MKKTIAMHQQRDNKHKADDGAPQSAVPAYLLEREQVSSIFVCAGRVRGDLQPALSFVGWVTNWRAWTCSQVDRAKVLSNTVKQKRKQKAGKWEVPLPKVRPLKPRSVLA